MIQFEIINNVGKITLNRPEKYHSFVKDMAIQLQNILDKCNENKSIRAIMITASGKAFCAGQDLAEATNKNGPSLTEIVENHYNPIIRKIRNIEKPVVAAVNGVAAGAGASLALCCDIVLCNENATFIQAFSKIGLIPDSAATFFLPRLIGMQRATALMMSAEPIVASEALKMGMIYKIFSNDDFESSSLDFVSKLSQMPTKGLGLTKRLLNSSYSNNLEEQLEMEKQCQEIAGKTNDFDEGVQAFLDKRKPNFKGN
ncbi:MAG: 2-(1,2-epoxy-1,2-dihydrophenyl)acetyl-CoA isomerase [Flavobacteriales bacterium]|jgi:2-(1,2-epoxy-1,2-dihydrophenyl)acetyl-CoA isomerase|nr:2-(1,2-epoxy-1,2-dihydrophenyl)acetyl-CoA isomerase [Flavobacteriales bacterium]MDA7596350.1 enoyl-CoA hydratase-related protein [Flavobacteriales bacterium]